MPAHHRSSPLRFCALPAAVLATLASGCGGAGSPGQVALVAGSAVTERQVEHWSVALERGGGQELAAQEAGVHDGRRATAEEFLIDARWLLAEASRLGVAPSARSVEARLAQEREAVPGGQEAFAEALASSGRTVADVELEIEVQLAAQALRRVALDRTGAVSGAAVAAAYRSALARYRTPEERAVDLVERLPSAAAARRLATQLGTGARFVRRAVREEWRRPAGFDSSSEKGRVLRAIFAARPGTLVGPMRLNGAWTLFVVRHVVPAGVRPLNAVRASIVTRLAQAQRAQALRRLEASMRERWRPLTSCRAGWVVPECARYERGELGAPLLAGA